MNNTEMLVVVTGGTKGIGKAIIEAFSSLGFTVATCSRHLKELQTLKQDIESRYHNTLHIFQADLSSRAEVSAFSQYVQATGLPVEVLVNNSGRFIPGEVLKEPEGVLETLIETNLYSAYHLIQDLVPSMQANKRGYVFNICSTASIMAFTNGGSYCISKFAMYGMSKVLREELKPYGVRVSSVMPGPTLTASWEGVDLPADRFIDPKDVADLITSTYQLSPRTVVEDLVIRPQLGDI